MLILLKILQAAQEDHSTTIHMCHHVDSALKAIPVAPVRLRQQRPIQPALVFLAVWANTIAACLPHQRRIIRLVVALHNFTAKVNSPAKKDHSTLIRAMVFLINDERTHWQHKRYSVYHVASGSYSLLPFWIYPTTPGWGF